MSSIWINLSSNASNLASGRNWRSNYKNKRRHTNDKEIIWERKLQSNKIEYDLKDELIRQTIMDTQDDVEEIKETIDKIDQRLYELQQRR